MRNWSIEDVGQFLILVAVCLFVGGLMAAGGFALWDKIAESRRKIECEQRGGIVQHYDQKHESYWRCAVSSAEAP